jgi:stage V sporulation protein AA
VGIIVFFNHFMGKKITDDPTPIEVEMALYETEVVETVLDALNTQKMGDEQGGNN